MSARRRWEYRVLKVNGVLPADQLNELDSEGWELHLVTHGPIPLVASVAGYLVTYYMRRPGELTAQTGAVRRLYSTVELDEKREALGRVLQLVKGE